MDEQSTGDYRARFPAVAEDRWFPPVCDPAMIGMVERLGELAPIYSHAALTLLWAGFTPEALWSTLHELCARHPNVLVMYQPARDAFWRRVREKQFLAWELLTPAIHGVAAYGTEPTHAVVYNRAKVLEILASTITDSEGADPGVLAVADYRSKLLACNAGRKAPWYFFS